MFIVDIEMKYPTKHKEVTEIWSGAEESLFRVVADIYRSNYCAISKLLWNKSCKQVSSDEDRIISSATIQNAISAFSQYFRRNKKLNFFFQSGSLVLKSCIDVQNMSRNDILVCFQCFMQCANLMKLQCSSGFLSNF